MSFPSPTIFPGTGGGAGIGDYPGTGAAGPGDITGGPMVYPATDLYPADDLYPVSEQEEVRSVRERAPLRLHATILTPNGHRYRWGVDEPNIQNALGAETHSATMPGGFESCQVTLARQPSIDYDDLQEFSTITVQGAGDAVAWQGRLEQTPSTSGDQLAITPAAVGWQAALDDNQNAVMPYLDCDLSHWIGESVQDKLNDALAAWTVQDATSTPDATTGFPSLEMTLQGGWGQRAAVKSFYDSHAGIGRIYYAWKKNSVVNATDANWTWTANVMDDDVESNPTSSGNLRAAGPGKGNLAGSGKRWAMLYFAYGIAGGASGIAYSVFWTSVAVLGNHGLTVRGTDAYQPGGIGLYASDIVGHAVQTWAPKLAVTRAGASTITPSTFAIPHVVFLDATTASAIVKEVTKYDLQDWAVWEGPAFWWHPPGARGRKWRARVGPARLSETGPQVDRIWNSVIVQYRDVSGATRTVGPTGSVADSVDASLADPDPSNPATVAGLTRRALLAMATSTTAGATKVAQAFLAQQKVLATAGDATLTGHVEDEHGVLWPAWMVRPGDQIAFVDAHDTTYRRIVRTSWNDSTKEQSITLDSPPQGLQALLERLGAVLVPFGITS